MSVSVECGTNHIPPVRGSWSQFGPRYSAECLVPFGAENSMFYKGAGLDSKLLLTEAAKLIGKDELIMRLNLSQA
jgi:hypothetical protein